MKWKNEKNELERLIKYENLSYEEIGRKYGCSGSNIKKVAYRLGIELPIRRKVNETETFNRDKGKFGICKNCGKEFKLYQGTSGKYCSQTCQREYEYEEWLKRWKSGLEDGVSGGYSVSKRIRRYLFEKFDSKCEKCGWGEINEYTGNVPLQIHHIDGNCLNNSEENLQLLCPNCHSLTENFGSRNINATEGRSEYFGSEKRKLRKIKKAPVV